MKLKKTNAVCGLITIVLLLVHAVYQMVTYVKFIYDPAVTMLLGYMILAALIIHMALSMSIFFFAHDGSNLLKYPRENRRTIVQRAGAIAMLALCPLHLKNYSIMTAAFLGKAGPVIAALVQVLFYAAVFAHISASLSSAFVTLGMPESPDTKRKLDRAVDIISVLAFIICSAVTVRTYILMAAMGGGA